MNYEILGAYGRIIEQGDTDNADEYFAEMIKFYPEIRVQLEQIQDYLVIGEYTSAADLLFGLLRVLSGTPF